jgi:hypothetical protein
LLFLGNLGSFGLLKPWGGTVKDNRSLTGEDIKLDVGKLLGLSQVAKVLTAPATPKELGRLLSKIGEVPDISDVCLKRDIEHLATRPDGLPIYAFKYVWDEEVHVGVMAQDLLRNDLWRPAVLTKANGYFAVDYGRLGLRMTTLDEWRAKSMAALELGN